MHAVGADEYIGRHARGIVKGDTHTPIIQRVVSSESVSEMHPVADAGHEYLAQALPVDTEIALFLVVLPAIRPLCIYGL